VKELAITLVKTQVIPDSTMVIIVIALAKLA